MAARKRQETVFEEKRGRGRPATFRLDFVRQAATLCEMGATDEEIAEFFGVSTRTLIRWKAAHPEFCQALKSGKAFADDRVERSLYQRAVGYEQEAVKIFMPANKEEPVFAKYKERVAPDVGAAIFWLKNRRSEEWKDKRHVETDNRHHHTAEPVSESSGWLAGVLGAAEDCEAEEPVQGGSLLPVEVRSEREPL